MKLAYFRSASRLVAPGTKAWDRLQAETQEVLLTSDKQMLLANIRPFNKTYLLHIVEEQRK